MKATFEDEYLYDKNVDDEIDDYYLKKRILEIIEKCSNSECNKSEQAIMNYIQKYGKPLLEDNNPNKTKIMKDLKDMIYNPFISSKSITKYQEFILDKVLEDEKNVDILFYLIVRDKTKTNDVLKKSIEIFKTNMNNNIFVLSSFLEKYKKSEIYDEKVVNELLEIALNEKEIIAILDEICALFPEFVNDNYDKLVKIAKSFDDYLLIAQNTNGYKQEEMLKQALNIADNDELLIIYDFLEKLKK